MKKRFVALFMALSSQLLSVESAPWLGNWLEFEGSLYQKHTQARHVDTTHGAKKLFLHSEKTVCALEFMPLTDLSCSLELDLAKTQEKAYGFEALKTGVRYNVLDDLTGDLVSLTPGVSFSLSTPSRIKDLSSTERAVFEGNAFLSCGREFGYTDDGLYRAWAMALVGAGSSGSPWASGEVHLEKEISEKHTFDLFFTAEKGFSSHKLHHVHDFQSYSRLGYRFEEVGLKYTLKEIALGSFYIQGTKRLGARYCPKASWSIELGFMIPFSPW